MHKTGLNHNFHSSVSIPKIQSKSDMNLYISLLYEPFYIIIVIFFAKKYLFIIIYLEQFRISPHKMSLRTGT